jgi:ubiquinone/menaquinone biosynthesis C-methylase UbiE
MPYTDYNTIGTGYDTTRRADPYLTERLLHLLGRPKGAAVLDIGCGTGNYTIALQAKGHVLTGVDPSERMLVVARDKSDTIHWIAGRVEALPFDDASFDGAIATLTTHHWSDMEQGFREVRRVLRPGAVLVLLTSTPEQMQRYWLCHYFPGIMERSCVVMPTFEATASALRAAGFREMIREPYDIRPDLQDLFLYSAKQDPARYLDAGFRNGISTFAALSDDTELTTGLEHLAADIATGAWERVRARYAHDRGDYLFIKAVR